MNAAWRVVDTGPAPGPFTAALDEAFARARSRGRAPDTLHFYSRRPPAVTLGYFLDAAEVVDIGYCRSKGIDIVRRLSGGGAVYTDDRQLVYSLISRGVLPATAADALGAACEGVARALCRLGAGAAFCPPNDVLVGGRKVSGSAQFRKWGVAVIHGTVLVDADLDGMSRALRAPGPGAGRRPSAGPGKGVTTLREALGRAPPLEEVRSALAAAFSEVLGVRMEEGSATPEELASARELVAERYGDPAWNLGGRRDGNP